ncbi:MAG: hypothetical protein RIS64_912 [Bacteroidota bacterium]|jgi:hypothetical protein
MKYVISFTICLFSVALVHGQTVPKKPKKRTKHATTAVVKPAMPTKTELDEVTPVSAKTAIAPKVEVPPTPKAIITTTHSQSMSSDVSKTVAQPSIFSVRTGTPKEDETADARKTVTSGMAQPDFEESEVKTAKEKLATDAQLKPESVTLESNPFGIMPGERKVPTPTGQLNQPVEVPNLLVRSDPKQDDASVVTAPQPIIAPVVAVPQPVTAPVVTAPQPVAIPVDNGLATRGEAKKVEIVAKKEEALDKMAIMTFEHKTKDLGRMRLGESRNHTFTFTNKGSEPVEIELMDVCPCTHLEWDKNPIPPGATSTIKARFDSQKVFPEGVNHEIEKVITIILKNTDPKNGYPLIEELKIKAFVEYQFQD